MPTARISLIFGTASFGAKPVEGAWGADTARIHDIEQCQAVLDLLSVEHGYTELDAARIYSQGTSEEYLSKLNLHGAVVDTKCFPFAPGDHEPAKLRATLKKSIQTLGGHKIRIFYLHAPDRATPFEATIEEINKLHKEGLFEEFGLSNYYAWEVAQIYAICKERGYVLPTVYQGSYNLLARTPEAELFPALRKLNIRFMGFNPLAGGLLAGSLKSKEDVGQPGGRYDSKNPMGRMYRARYTQGNQFKALEVLSAAAAKHNLSVGEIALRWLQHHSQLTPTDRVVLGASRLEQVKENISNAEKGPLPEDVVQAAEKAWLMVKPDAPLYAFT